ncbi:MAG: hypothetical protein H6868_03160 [Rhodospirillales bacterium]|nr:hypothetical protein [Rhodospirillales bacterium]
MMNEKIIENIKQDKYSREELENLYANAERLGHEDVLAAAKEALKEIDSRSYSKRFIKPIRDKVFQITTEIAEENGWSKWEDNKVENGVKVGGPMMNGEELAEYYFSYRHPSWKRSSYLAVFQHDEESPVQYKIKAHDGEEQTVDTSGEAIALFRSAITM